MTCAKFWIVLFVLASAVSFETLAQRCRKMRVRREIHDISPREILKFTNAIKLLYETPTDRMFGSSQKANDSFSIAQVQSEEYQAAVCLLEDDQSFNTSALPEKDQFQKGFDMFKAEAVVTRSFDALQQESQSMWDEFVIVHGKTIQAVHQTPSFLPWHRWLLYQLETKLQELSGDPDLTIPYWAWSYGSDARDPLVLKYFGGSAGTDESGKSLPIPDGPFKDWRGKYPNDHAVRRGYDPDEPLIVHHRQCFDAVFEEYPYDFENFRPMLEIMHNTFHGRIKGDMMDVNIAPNDPMFYIHHGYVDYEWWKWQQLDPDNVKQYLGFDVVAENYVDETDELPGFGVPVGRVLHSESLCVTYAKPRKAIRLQTASVAEVPPMSPFEMGLMGLTQAQVDLVSQLQGKLRELCRRGRDD